MRIRIPPRRIQERFLLIYELKGCQEAVNFLTEYYEVRKMKMSLPPIEIQREITAILEKAEKIKQKREQANLMANKILKAVFLKTFGLQVAKGEISKLGFLDVFNVTTGKLNSNAAVENGDYPFFTCSRQTFRINQYSFDCEALILSGNNAAGEYSVKHYNGKFDAYQRTYVLTLKNKSYYEYFQFLLENKLQELKTLSIGTNTKYLTLRIMKNIQLPILKVEHQEEFSKIAKELGKIKEKQHESAKEIDILFDSLISEAFKGELVTEVN